MDDTARILRELDEIKAQQKDLKEQLARAQAEERKRTKELKDVATHINNADKLFHIFKYYDQVFESGRTRKLSGKVVLRSGNRCTPQGFEKIREVAKLITNYPEFSRRSDGYVNQKTIHRRLNEIDESEMKLVVECTEEIIEVLYKYKKMCEKYQNKDFSEYVVESEVV